MESFVKKYTEGWDYKTKQEATSLLNEVTTSFEFIISLIGLYRLLQPLAGITNRLQGRDVDAIETYNDVSSVIKDIKAQGRIWTKVYNNKSLKFMGRVYLTMMLLALSYRHGNANGLNVMTNCDQKQ